MPEINTTNIGFEKQIWDANCQRDYGKKTNKFFAEFIDIILSNRRIYKCLK